MIKEIQRHTFVIYLTQKLTRLTTHDVKIAIIITTFSILRS